MKKTLLAIIAVGTLATAGWFGMNYSNQLEMNKGVPHLVEKVVNK